MTSLNIEKSLKIHLKTPQSVGFSQAFKKKGLILLRISLCFIEIGFLLRPS